MSMNDPIADFFSAIRNGIERRAKQVVVRHSTVKQEIARVLQENGFIRNITSGQNEAGQPQLTLELKYTNDGINIIHELKRVSKPGRRVYMKHDEIPVYQNGIGMYVVSTTQGMVSDRTARKNHTGGEIICSVA